MTLGAGSSAQARSLRIASAHLTARLSRAARCDPAQSKLRYRRCVLPALRSASIAGQTTARLAAVVAMTIPAGPCRAYLLEVQAADAAAGEQGAYLLGRLYVHDAAAQREVDIGLGRAAAMLARASTVRTATCAGGQRPDIWGRPLPELSP